MKMLIWVHSSVILENIQIFMFTSNFSFFDTKIQHVKFSIQKSHKSMKKVIVYILVIYIHTR